ncbi:unnamed protein product [Ostreobium quekettii]|uniref:CAP-Gly domain-containing protein n=1 Tax=Ostreobium quekettii TaxID=121088 RepID=A0A8S1J1Q2_9CHLO|nr:unnamed protein product [Ostreobium quekettii]
MTTDDDARVGLRVQVGADKATVRYLGPVEGQEGEWAGVEWDDASRGKHDGCAGGRRYFQTARGANSGSFVRLGKVDWGVAAPEALVRRYQGLYGPPEDGDDENWEEMYVQTAGNRRRGVELVGMEKVHRRQSDMLRLRAAVLRGCRVASGGPAGEVARLVPNVEELDLSDNLITSWDVVVQIARQLSRLEVLNLSKNRLSFPESQEPSHGSLLECLKTLILKECDNSWGQVLDLLPHVPSLTSLHICYNSLSSLSSTTAGYDALRKLELLDLECNNICSWEEVWPLNTLPALKRLHLGSNPISNITYPKSHSLDVPPFPALQCLLLGDCLVGDWASVDSLNRFPSLVETRLTGNPLIKSTHGGGRFEVRLARLIE